MMIQLQLPLVLAVLFSIIPVTVASILVIPTIDRCTSLTKTFKFPNGTVTRATHVQPNTTLLVPGLDPSCSLLPFVTTGSSPVCRVEIVVNTSSTSSVKMEAWLPDVWYGRTLGLGNGGLAGCIDYATSAYGTGLHFATIGSNNGHDGTSGQSFLNHPETLIDFVYRSIHIESLVIKSLVKTFYGRPHHKSYYLGCSTGGRQAFKNAEMFPDDFDGLVAGAPGVDWNHLIYWVGYVGDLNSDGKNQSLIGVDEWNTVDKFIMDKCDGLDGKLDQIITEPDLCQLDFDALACPSGGDSCLEREKIDIIKKVFEPVLDQDGSLIYPRYDPGAEADLQWIPVMGGEVNSIVPDWFRFAIFNDSNLDLRGKFTLDTVHFADRIDPSGVSTFSGDLTEFSAGGGKIISYHGRRDQGINSGISKHLYRRILSVMKLPTLDPFLRTFMIPGMGHCAGGNGAINFGQAGEASNLVNDSDHNVLLALVDWVEGGRAPATIIGSTMAGNVTTREERVHCRWPIETSVLGKNGVFECVPNVGEFEAVACQFPASM